MSYKSNRLGMLALVLAKHFGINLIPQPTGNYATTFTQVMTKRLAITGSTMRHVVVMASTGAIGLIAVFLVDLLNLFLMLLNLLMMFTGQRD